MGNADNMDNTEMIGIQKYQINLSIEQLVALRTILRSDRRERVDFYEYTEGGLILSDALGQIESQIDNRK